MESLKAMLTSTNKSCIQNFSLGVGGTRVSLGRGGGGGGGALTPLK